MFFSIPCGQTAPVFYPYTIHNTTIQKFPECKNAFEELLDLQSRNSLGKINSNNSAFVKMALDSQQYFWGSL